MRTIGRCAGLMLILACGEATSHLTDAGSGDPRCSVENCHALLQCALMLQGAPFSTGCLSLAQETGVTSTINEQYCVEACQTNAQGPVVDCVAQFAGACADAGLELHTVAENAVAACTPDAGPTPAQQACYSQCATTSEACSNLCPLDTGVDACYACAYPCAQARVQCNNGC